jgi:hypothetical protein
VTIESVTYISDLNASYPAGADAKSEGDNHIRNLKTGIKTTFPNVSGAVTPTHTELNYVDGVTSAIQTQMDLKAPLASPTFTGTVVLPATTSIDVVSATEIGYLNGVTSALQTQIDAKAPLASPTLTGTPAAPTAAAGTNTTQIATTAFVIAEAFSSALPSQTGNSGKIITTDGATASWGTVTGTGDAVRATSPTLVTPALGTPSALVLTNATGLPVAGGGTGAATFTDGGVLIGNTTGAIQATSAGTAGQVLTSNGAGVDPTFQAGVGLVLLATGPASSSAALDFTTLIDSTYDEYVFELVNIVPATNGALLWVRTSADAGSNWDSASGDYFYKGQELVTGIGTPNDVDSSSTATKLLFQGSNGIGNTAAWGGLNGTIRLFNPASATHWKQIAALVAWHLNAVAVACGVISGSRASATAVNGVRFLMSTGNIASGSIRMYGVRKA